MPARDKARCTDFSRRLTKIIGIKSLRVEDIASPTGQEAGYGEGFLHYRPVRHPPNIRSNEYVIFKEMVFFPNLEYEKIFGIWNKGMHFENIFIYETIKALLAVRSFPLRIKIENISRFLCLRKLKIQQKYFRFINT